MISSAEDGTGLLQPSTVREMWRKQNEGVARDFDFSVGLTWWPMSLPGLEGTPVVGHGGDLDAYHALLLISPGHKVGVFVMANGVDGVGSFSLGDAAIRALQGMIEVQTGVAPAVATAAPAPAPIPADASRRLPGYYATPQGICQVKLENGRLKVFAFGNWMDGVYRSDGSIALEARILFIKLPIPILDEMSLTLESAEGVDYLNMRLHGLLFAPCQKVTPVSAPASWLARAGKYKIENPDPGGMLTALSLVQDRESGFYFVAATIDGSVARLPLHEFTDSEARLMGYGRNLGTTIRFVQTEGGEKLMFLGHVLSRIP